MLAFVLPFLVMMVLPTGVTCFHQLLASVSQSPKIINPKLPIHFQMKWRIIASTNNNDSIPLYWNPLPPNGVKYMIGTGSTYYNFDHKAMLEVYDDFCVPIFGPLEDKLNRFRCHFLNVNLASYLISLDESPFPPCCVFGAQVFHPPEPDFLKHMVYNSSGEIMGEPVNWWVLDSDPNDPAEPFGYGFYKKSSSYGEIPAAFWFRTVNGFSIQYFYKFEEKNPDPDVWRLPSICVNAPSCGYLN